VTGQRGRGGFSVAPQPLGGPPGGRRARGRALGIAVVGSVAAAILAIGWLGPRTPTRPTFDGVVVAPPAATLSLPPDVAFPTSLPELTGDAARFSGTIGVASDVFRIVDLGSGETIASYPIVFNQDAIVPAPGGAGWVCICMAGGSVQDVQLVHLDPLGKETGREIIGRLGSGSGRERSISIRTAFDFAPDGRTGLLAVAVQDLTGWTYSVARLDMEAGTLGPLLELGTQRPDDALSSPAPALSQRIVVGPQVRLAPDGDRAFVWATLHVGDGPGGTSESVGWSVRLDKVGEATSSEPVPDLASDTICFVGGFLARDRFVAECFQSDWSIDTFDADGVLTQRVEKQGAVDFGSDMLFDTANGAIWVWNGAAQNLSRIDASTGKVVARTFAAGAPPTSDDEDLGTKPPVWVRPDANVPLPRLSWPQMAGAPDGARLYLLGYANKPGAIWTPLNVGILAVDPRTMALRDRWTADAAYASIDTGRDGSVVIASGLAGMNERGDQSLWDASLTYHDATDGTILARYGRLGRDGFPMIIEP